MKKVNPILLIRISAFAILGLTSWAGQCQAEDIRSVLASPSSYHGKRVTVTGIARGDPDRFYLFANTADAIALKVQQALDVFPPDHWRQTGPVSLRKVRISGIVDANWHGHSGIACALRLEKLNVLSDPVAPWPDPVTVFRNETSKAVVVHLGVFPTETKFEIPPSGVIDVEARDGVVRATSLAGDHVAKTKISKRAAAPFYDPVNAASYYRIKQDKIENVLPNSATSWGWRR